MSIPLEEADGYQQALAQGWLPIREVARLTGVNPVTLRAWERRYGLIVPQRTGKGHRLYDAGHVQRVQTILTWLNRGVAVSQVKTLLEAPPVALNDEHNPWSELRGELLDAIGLCAERSLDDRFNHAMALYPPGTLCAQLLMPLLTALEQRWQGQLGARLEQVLFHGWLRSKLGLRIYHNNRQLGGAPLLLANLGEQPVEPGLWLCAWLASSADCPVELLEWLVPTTELQLAIERLRPRAVLLYASQAQDSQFLQRQLPRLLQQSGCPVIFVGPAASIHASDLQRLAIASAADPLQAIAQLKTDGLLAASEVNPS